MILNRPPTKNLEDFPIYALKKTADIINELIKSGFPAEFNQQGIKLELCPDSKFVYLTNDDHQVCLINTKNPSSLEIFFTCGNCGHEGFYDDICYGPDDRCVACHVDAIG